MGFGKFGPRATLWAASSMLILASCQTMTPTGATSETSFCDAAMPISYSTRDTPETRKQIIAHNCVGAVLCGWQAPENICK